MYETVDDSVDAPLTKSLKPASIPRVYALAQNYPNPFNPTTTISYDLPVASGVTLTIYNLLGREVARLVNTHQPAGRYGAHWKATNAASGIYFYRLEALPSEAETELFTETRKMLLLR